mmetsp:Transcript_160613/g.283201  ORF Transcript_160613/g.283201 Transcript_160613/m.283201 type:complete len:242 (-) Transcript_160613:246-971(-)
MRVTTKEHHLHAFPGSGHGHILLGYLGEQAFSNELFRKYHCPSHSCAIEDVGEAGSDEPAVLCDEGDVQDTTLGNASFLINQNAIGATLVFGCHLRERIQQIVIGLQRCQERWLQRHIYSEICMALHLGTNVYNIASEDYDIPAWSATLWGNSEIPRTCGHVITHVCIAQAACNHSLGNDATHAVLVLLLSDSKRKRNPCFFSTFQVSIQMNVNTVECAFSHRACIEHCMSPDNGMIMNRY